MSRGEQSRGICTYCGHIYTKAGMTKHLSACPERGKGIEKAEQEKAKMEKLFHLRVQAQSQTEFWLDLEMRGSATLENLDYYLRHIWLECCGHLSQFSVGGWRGDEIPKTQTISRVFERGVELTHIYDFGTSSYTLIKAVEARVGNPLTDYPIALMARNLMPRSECIICQKDASWLCMECLIEHDLWGSLCNKHFKNHPHKDYGEPIPLVNSPRVGLCGYCGPADPPY